MEPHGVDATLACGRNVRNGVLNAECRLFAGVAQVVGEV